MNSLQGKSALVTGGTRGIGRAVVEALLEAGVRVLFSGREAAGVAQAERECSTRGEVRGEASDVRVRAQVDALVARAEKEFGGLDFVVNNAGLGVFKTVEELTDEEWDQVLHTNLTGVFYVCRAAIPALRRRGGGYIVNIGSLAGKQAFPSASAYCASKFGLLGLSEALMQEVRYDHIRVTCVMPGSVDTAFGRATGAPAPWKLQSSDVAAVVLDLVRSDPRALASRVELRPSEPARKS